VLDETRDHIERLKRAGGDDETLKLKSELTRPGLTKPSDASTTTETETVPDTSESAEAGETSPSGTDDSTIEAERTEPHPGDGTEPTDDRGDDTTGDDPAVESVDADPDNLDVEESSKSDDTGRTALALIPSEKTIEANKPLNIEVRDETGGRVADATIEYPGGTTSTDDRGTCTVRLADPGDIDLRVSKEGGYGTDTVTITVQEESTTDDTIEARETGDAKSKTDSRDEEAATGTDNRGTLAGEDGDNSIDNETDEVTVDDEAANGPTSVVPVPGKTMVEPGKTVEFTVRDAQGDRVADAIVESEHESERTDNRGRCRLTFDSAGTYEVAVVDGPEAPYESDTVSITVE
jgi:plastocyanin